MIVFEMELERGAEFVGAAFNFFRPPPSHIVDCVKDLFGRYAHRNGCGEIPIRAFAFFGYFCCFGCHTLTFFLVQLYKKYGGPVYDKHG
jgi:hypothetical protein